MPNWIRAILCVALLALAGCATPEYSRTVEPPAPIQPSMVPPRPPIAPPPTNTPALARPAVPTNLPTVVAVVTSAPPVQAWVPLQRWGTQEGFGTPKKTGVVPPTFTLSSNNGTLVLAAGSREARWNGTEIALGFAPQLSGSDLLLHPLDVQKNLVPLTVAAPLWTTNRVIVIDPGHGGIEKGATSPDGHFEKDYTLDWARRLEPLLRAEGWTVFLTRTSDLTLPLSNRVAFAEQHHADLFLSLHFNSDTNHNPSGLETYLLTPTGMPSNLVRNYGDDVSQIFPNNSFDAANLQLALRLHRALLAVGGNADRGVRHARFLAVLRGQHRPAVLLEGGYLSNPVEARRIADARHRQQLAEAVARALQ